MTDQPSDREGANAYMAQHRRWEAQLKPCPLCGGALTLYRHHNSMRPPPECDGGYYAECIPCVLQIDPDCDAVEAIEKINRRPEQEGARGGRDGDVERKYAALKADYLQLVNAFSPRNATLKLLHSLAKDLGACNDGDGHFLIIAADIVEKHIKPPPLPPIPEPEQPDQKQEGRGRAGAPYRNADGYPSAAQLREVYESHRKLECAPRLDELCDMALSQLAKAEVELDKREGAGGEAKWIACSERMPKDGDTVIVHGGVAQYADDKWWSRMGPSGGKIQWSVTHWRPLGETTPPMFQAIEDSEGGGGGPSIAGSGAKD